MNWSGHACAQIWFDYSRVLIAGLRIWIRVFWSDPDDKRSDPDPIFQNVLSYSKALISKSYWQKSTVMVELFYKSNPHFGLFSRVGSVSRWTPSGSATLLDGPSIKHLMSYTTLFVPISGLQIQIQSWRSSQIIRNQTF